MLIELSLTLITKAVVPVLAFDHYRNPVDNRDFDYFVFTLIYPTAVCRADDDAVKDACEVPENAAPWTIHGLWPNYRDGSYPEFCGGKEDKFNLSKLAPIEQELEINWPNLFPKRSLSSLWKHEWKKHGTCAKEVPEVDDEFKYFKKSLELDNQLDIFRVLNSQRIKLASDESNNLLQIKHALQSAYGKIVDFDCLRDKETKKWFLADVRFCLTKSFQLMDCEHKRSFRYPRNTYPLPKYHSCPEDGIFYIPSNGARLGTNSIWLFLPFIIFTELYH